MKIVLWPEYQRHLFWYAGLIVQRNLLTIVILQLKTVKILSFVIFKIFLAN